MSTLRKFFSDVGEVVGAISGAVVGTAAASVAFVGHTATELIDGKSLDEATTKAGGTAEKVMVECIDGGTKVGKVIGSFAPELVCVCGTAVLADQLRKSAEANGAGDLPSRPRTLVDGAHVGAKIGEIVGEFVDKT